MLKQIKNSLIVMLLFSFGISLLCACSTTEIPDKWKDLKITDNGLVEIEKETDENGLYLRYEGISRDDLLRNVSQSLVASNYKEVSTAFKGSVIGFIKGDDKLAVKIDQFDKTLYLAIFNEKGKEPLLHGVVFGNYKANRIASGEKAREMLNNELKE